MSDNELGSSIGAMLGGGSTAIDAMLGALDLSKASSEYKIIPAGTEVFAKIIKITPGKTKEKNADKLDVRLQVVGSGEWDNVVIFDTITFSAQALWKWKSLAKACHMLSEDGSAFVGSIPAMINEVVKIKVLENVYNEKTTNKVDGGYAVADGYVESSGSMPSFE